MQVLALDPGPENSALIKWDGKTIHMARIEANAVILDLLGKVPPEENIPLVIEKIESYGMAVGAETFETVFWSGRFAQHFGFEDVHRMGRKPVKIHICGSARATDSNIRTALIDRFGGTSVAIGKKNDPGPLYPLKSHLWAAFALAVTWLDTNQPRPQAIVESVVPQSNLDW